MEIVIKIPKEKYLYAKNLAEGGKEKNPVVLAIGNGTPLPEGHGDLIDKDALYEQYAYTDCNFDMTMEYVPTVVEADTVEREE